jgi:hypothetical protein
MTDPSRQDIAQIQVVPVENGFLIQCINADGSGLRNPRRVALTREDLAKEIKNIADILFTKEPPKPEEQAVPSPQVNVPPEEVAPVGATVVTPTKR